MALTNSVSDITLLIRGFVKDQARTDGRVTYSFDNDNKFTLPQRFPKEDNITVFRNGTEMSISDWEYNSNTNQVEIDPQTSGDALESGDVILILFHYYKIWSDDEIKQYLASSLGYFAQHRYKKIFELTDDDFVVSINDRNPDEKELYFIAIIASILIDPQNIKISQPEFSLSANRNLSDQDQIKIAFTQFKRMIGNISFDQTFDERGFN